MKLNPIIWTRTTRAVVICAIVSLAFFAKANAAESLPVAKPPELTAIKVSVPAIVVFALTVLMWRLFSAGMARKLRVQYPGAIYHVINRGDRRKGVGQWY
jgi:hypothetical protein